MPTWRWCKVVEWPFWENCSWHSRSYSSCNSITVEESDGPWILDGVWVSYGAWGLESASCAHSVGQTSSSSSQRYGYSDHSTYSVAVPFQTHLVIRQENCVPCQMNHVLRQRRPRSRSWPLPRPEYMADWSIDDVGDTSTLVETQMTLEKVAVNVKNTISS